MLALRVLLAAAVLLSANEINPDFKHISIYDGLSQGTVFAILQDSRGFMWFGTEDGLNRFNGYEFEIFKNDLSDSASLHNNFVTALLEDKNGFIWIGTIQGLSRYNPRTGHFLQITQPQLADVYVNNLTQEPAGNIWIATLKNGVFVFDQADNIVKNYNSQNGLSDDRTWKVIADKDGVWIATSSGLNYLDLAGDTVNTLRFPQTDDNAIRDFIINSDGTLWICFYNSGIGYLDITNNIRNIYATGLKGQNARKIMKDGEGRIWIATMFDGVNIFDPDNGTLQSLRYEKENPRSLSGNYVESLYRDKNGLIWVGCNANGVNLYDPYKRKFTHIGAENGLSDVMVYEVYEDPKYSGEIVWIGTDKGGLNRLEKSSGQFTVYSKDENNPYSLQNNSVRVVFRDKNSRLWIGTANGLFLFDETNAHFKRLEGDNPELSSISVRALLNRPGEEGDVLWIGGASMGFVRYDLQNRTYRIFEAKEDGGILSSGFVRSAMFDHMGDLWIGTLGGGLNRLHPDEDRIDVFMNDPQNPNSLSNNIVLSIIEEISPQIRDVLWLGTAAGISRLDPQTGTFSSLTQKDGLPNDVIYAVLQDDKGRLWASTNKGISRYNPVDSSFKNFDVADGLQGEEFNAGAYDKSITGNLYFGGINGVNYFHPDSIMINTSPPRVHITRFKKFNKETDLPQAITFTEQLDLSYKDDFFSFEFAAIDYSAPEKVEYAYMMEGFDKDWIYGGNRRYAGYTNLDPGEYRFRVKAANSDGVWNEQGASLAVSITTPPWRSWWAYLLYALGFVLLVQGIRWVVKNRKSILALRKKKISHYKLIEVIGEGGLGIVYKAVDFNTNEQVAVKLLKPDLLEDEKNRQRFTNEGRMLTELEHEHIINAYEIGEADKQGYIAMEYLPGGTLQQYVHRSHPLEIKEIQRICLQITDALELIHEKKIIHRDLKTSNIMLDENGNVRVMDFGLSKSPIVATMTTLGTLMGTLGYVAPEQITNIDVDHRVDIFSFGAILYEMLTNTLPFTGENEMAMIHAIFNARPEKPSVLRDDVVPDWDAIVFRCLEKEPSRRYQSFSEIRDELKELNLIPVRL